MSDIKTIFKDVEEQIRPNYFVIFFDDNHNIFHATGYEKYPKIADLFHLVQELDTDEEFGIGKEIFLKNLDILTKEQFEEISE
jgi:hypothetical protein